MPSTSIRKFDYDPNTRVLSVWFVASGKHYEFLDVPAEAVAAFKAAFAKGVYFNSHIRNRYAVRLAPGRRHLEAPGLFRDGPRLLPSAGRP
ncbi:KTSC domain-containing protein [Mesorhizobium sp. M1252]|uniref:KTSC domain-containing protein n=2 Tax=Mesorhizobium TaxID=68287 RepID=UPI003336AA4B